MTPLSGPGASAGRRASPQREQGGRGASKRRAVGGLQGQGRRRQPSGNWVYLFYSIFCFVEGLRLKLNDEDLDSFCFCLFQC